MSSVQGALSSGTGGLGVVLLSLFAVACSEAQVGSTACPSKGSDTALAAAVCQSTRERFETLFGASMPPGLLVRAHEAGIRGERDRDRWSLVVPVDERNIARAGGTEPSPSGVAGAWRGVVAHEIGHIALDVFVYDRRPPQDPATYGTPLPDWIDEGVAVWMESQAKRDARIRSALSSAAPTVAQLVAAKHPNAGAIGKDGDVVAQEVDRIRPCPRCAGPQRDLRHTLVIRTRTFRDGRTVVDTTIEVPGAPAAVDSTSWFYGYSLLLVEYVHARGGPAAMRALIEREKDLQSGAKAPPFRGLAGLPSLPADSAAVEADWARWLEDRRRSR